MKEPTLQDRIAGGIVGGAVGDALGAPTECMHYRDIRDAFGKVRNFEDFTDEMLAKSKFVRSVAEIGLVTDDTVLSDLLLDCIIEHEGKITAYEFAEAWQKLDKPVPNPDGEDIVRLERLHFIERIPFYRNKLRDIQKRDLGRGESNATNAIMYIAPIGLLCAGDPSEAEFHSLFRVYGESFGCEYRQEVVEYLLQTHYRACGRPLRRCHPRDLLSQIQNYCTYHEYPMEMRPEYIDRVARSYFTVVAAKTKRPTA